ncbi:hypothetical protein L1987_42318 [Smallanthus sonchifolius]|uniref:Uncharacterized protein n=1 Tax=Smallanthus sonchifolius TaxID=185202 RepID=A0ACB9GIL1_9ASTR|nr:hypothetical protein L1987_42318 [Smallanthus sonchifolius]
MQPKRLSTCDHTFSIETKWVLNSPDPPGFLQQIFQTIKNNVFQQGNTSSSSSQKKPSGRVVALRTSLSIPQSIGNAALANLDPQYGLYGSVVPPLIYSVMGTSQELAIGPVAVVSLLISSMISKLVDPAADPASYRKLVFTVTFFAGTFQALFGFLRLGFLIDFLSAIVGFMAGAAIVIGLQQLMSLLGITHFTTKTDVVSVLEAVVNSFHTTWYPLNFVLGCSFLVFILITRFILEFNTPHLGDVAKIGFICAIIALTEAVAVGRSFASIKGYNLDGNKEMIAMEFMNIAGSMSSCYVATGSDLATYFDYVNVMIITN